MLYSFPKGTPEVCVQGETLKHKHDCFWDWYQAWDSTFALEPISILYSWSHTRPDQAVPGTLGWHGLHAKPEMRLQGGPSCMFPHHRRRRPWKRTQMKLSIANPDYQSWLKEKAKGPSSLVPKWTCSGCLHHLKRVWFFFKYKLQNLILRLCYFTGLGCGSGLCIFRWSSGEYKIWGILKTALHFSELKENNWEVAGVCK